MNNKALVSISIILGLIFVAVAIYYWMVPAGSLASFMPGYLDGSTQIHFKHGLASLIVGILLFIFAWFKSAKKNSSI